ncbi:hypothetical protein EMCRGX_G000576 [Ephydatia muelleri]
MSPTSGHTPLLGLLLCFAITTSYPVIPQPSPTALHPSGEQGKLFEGDIMLREGEHPHKTINERSAGAELDQGSGTSPAATDNEYLWPDNVIPWEYDPQMETSTAYVLKTLFQDAMLQLEQMSCIRFVRRTNETDYIQLTNTRGCSSFVGRKGGLQQVSVDTTCRVLGSTIHELSHALGMWHEHSRRDRDTYVTINYGNIQVDALRNFDILSVEEMRHVPSNVGYDIESIMHYGPDAFASQPSQSTISARPGVPCASNMGQRLTMSYKDQLRLNAMYQCTANLVKLQATPPRLCLGETPTPSVSSTSIATTPVPTPTSSSPVKTILSDTVITLQVRKPNMATQALECIASSVACRTSRCSYPNDGCGLASERFKIQLTVTRKNMNIKNGDTVVLKSTNREGNWVECNDTSCILRQCQSNDSSGDYNNTGRLQLQQPVPGRHGAQQGPDRGHKD